MTIELHNLRPKVRRQARKNLGRGNASGSGSYSGRGIKGQHSRSGGSHVAGFEGGRSSIIVQTPKMRGKGFRSLSPDAEAVNLNQLNKFKDGEIVTERTLRNLGIIESGPAKILGDGELKRKLDVRVPVSSSAREKIEKAGGTIAAPKAPVTEQAKSA